MADNNLSAIKAVIFDAVGVLFSHVVVFDSEKGEIFRHRSHIDGQGISFLRSAGIKVAFISSDKNGFLESLTNKLNNLPSVLSGKWEPIKLFSGISSSEKLGVIEEWLKESKLSFSDLAYMGDDIGDYDVMKKCSFPVCPISAEKFIKDISVFVSERPGGEGAIRDFCNAVLESKEISIFDLSSK